MCADVDTSMDSAAGGIGLINNLVTDYLKTRDESICIGVDSNTGEHTVVAGPGDDGIVRDDRISTAKRDYTNV